MSFQPPTGAPPPPAPAGYEYAPQIRPKKSSEQLISNGLIIAVVVLAGILLLVGAILTHSTRFLESDDMELIMDLNTVSMILMDVATFMLVVFLTLAAILRSDMHHWVRVALLLFAALVLVIIFTAVYSGSLISGLFPYYP